MKRYISLLAAGLLLAALSPSQTHAAANTWNNASTDFLWNTTSVNWTSPTIWANGDDAIFGAIGAGTVSLSTPITAHNVTINSADYTFASSGGSTLTLNGTTPTVTVGASNVTFALSVQGTAGLTVEGTSPTNKLTLQGDGGFGLPNQYTGGTFVKSGTLVLQASPVPAVGGIDQLDAGATVKYFNDTDGVNNIRVPNGQMVLSGQLTMTGGTFDLAGDDNQNQVPVPTGTGTIINSSEYSRAVLKMTGNGTTKVFSGIIADGGPVTNSIIAGKVSHRLDIDFQGGSGTFVMAGPNTYSGSTRRGSGVIQLSGAGTLGVVTTRTPAIGLRINGANTDPVLVDLNGTSQRISGMGGNGGVLGNTAAATISVLTMGQEDGAVDAGSPSWPGKLVEDAGILAITKIGTNTQTFSGGLHTYSGDTTVSNGTLVITGLPSPNSPIRLFTAQGTLALNYAGNAPVRRLYINGVRMPPGTYGNTTAPITGTGTITVAGPNTWNNASTDFLWNTTSANWTSPTVWADGDDAIFGATGAGTVTLGTAITAHSLTNTAGDYTFNAPGGSTLTLSGTTPTISVGTSNLILGVSLQGTNGLTVQGTSPTNKLTLAANTPFGQGNNYTGGTFVRSGTVVMNAEPVNGSSQYAIDSIEALDAGATVKFFNAFDGVNNVRVNQNGQIVRTAGNRINMTGGTFDTSGDDNRNQVPIVQGTGTILNSSEYARAVLKMVAGAGTYTFSGIIADGGPVTNSLVSGKVAHRLDIDCQDFDPGTVWVLTGANTYSGSLRITGGTLKLSGAGRMGIPLSTSPPNRINDGGHIDLNGTSQITQYLVSSGTDGQANLLGQIYNSAASTVSTYTVGAGSNGDQSWSGKFLDNLDNNAGGGVLALTKVGTKVEQLAGGSHTYSGPTTINDGILNFGAAASVAFAAPSPNSAIYINSPGILGLSYTGSPRPVKGLVINGVQMPNGIYGSETAPITGTGFIQVAGSTVQPMLSSSVSGGNITFSWAGGAGSFKLQSQTNALTVGISNNWADYPGGGSNPVIVPINPGDPTVFFRLAPAP